MVAAIPPKERDAAIQALRAGVVPLRAPLIFGYEPNRTWPTTLGRPGFVACRSDRQLMSTSRCVLHHVTTSVFSFQPVQANALKSLTQYEGKPEDCPSPVCGCSWR